MPGQGNNQVNDRVATKLPGVVAIGLTGGIGAGKSTALAAFAALGATTVSADAIVHDLYSKASFVNQLVKQFGSAIIKDDGLVDRRAVARITQVEPEALKWLEDLTHPLVRDEIAATIGRAPVGSVVVAEVPLLFESRFEGMFDMIVTVEADRHNRVTRSAERFDADVFARFEQLQASTQQRVAGSHVVIVNDDSPERLQSQVAEALVLARTLLGEAK